jgi:5-methylcytosine-specific restriction protein A
MPTPIPDGIRPEHIIAAIHDIDAGVHHGFGESTVYDLLYEEHRYPPKAVVGLAAGKILGIPLGPYDFKGGLESKCFEVLEKNGFTIVPKDGSDNGHSYAERKQNPDWTRDELIIALNAYMHVGSPFPAKDGKEILELSNVLNRLGEKLFPPNQRSETFRNLAGVYMKLMNFRRLDPAYTSQGKVGLTRGSAGEQEVWDEFYSNSARCEKVAKAIIDSLEDEEIGTVWSRPDVDDEFEEAPEGRLLTRQHVVRERNKKLVKQKISRAVRQHGKLECEVCSFDFAAVYGKRGEGFIECHHTKPVADLCLGARTHIDDLVLLCSNCHRMIHRSRPWLSIEGLRALLHLSTVGKPDIGDDCPGADMMKPPRLS